MIARFHRIGDYFTETDFYGAYAEGARMIQHGHLDPSRYGVVGPGYDVALAIVGLAVRNLFVAAEVLSLLAVVTMVLAWRGLLARRLAPRAGFAAALLLAANGTLFRYGYAATTDALALALTSAAVFALLAGVRPRAALVAGVLAGLAFLTRYTTLVLLPLGVLAIALGGTLQAARRRALALFVGGAAVPVLPWVAYSLVRGQGFHSQLHHNIAYEVYAHARGIPWDEYQAKLQPQFHSLRDVIARDPGAVASRMAFNLVDHLRQDARSLFGLPAAVAALVGLALGWRDGAWRRLWAVPVGGLLFFLALVPVFYSERYSLAVLPFALALAAWTFAAPLPFRGGRAAQWLMLAGVVAFSLTASFRLQARTLDQLPVEALEAAHALKGLARPGDAVIARKPHVAFHAGVRAVPFPFARTLPELATAARTAHARWLYISWPEVETRPQFYTLLDTSGHVPGLVPRAVTRPHPAVLYEIAGGFGATPAWTANDTLRTVHLARALLLVNPHHLKALKALGDFAPTVGALPEARTALERLVTLTPDDADAWIALGQVALQQRDAAGAETAFEHALGLDPTSAEAQIGRGWAALLAQREDVAAELWRPVAGIARDRQTLARMVALFRARGDRASAETAAKALAALGGVR